VIVQYRTVQASETSIILCNPFMVSESWHLGFENKLKTINLETDFENFCIYCGVLCTILYLSGFRSRPPRPLARDFVSPQVTLSDWSQFSNLRSKIVDQRKAQAGKEKEKKNGTSIPRCMVYFFSSNCALYTFSFSRATA
jgi:hypothetical protein